MTKKSMETKRKRKVFGLSREEEEKQLADIIRIAEDNLEKTKRLNKELTEELKDMQESYDTRDKEILALWHNTESQFQESKKDLMRCLKALSKPYFGRIDFKDPKAKEEESYYIGRVGIRKNVEQPVVIDWRAPIASLYYENNLGPCTYEVKQEGSQTVDLTRKRTYEIAKNKLVDFFDSDVVANDELLTKYLAKSKKAVLSDIIGTIQKEQNAIIRKSPKNNMIVQGVAGSGKTTVAMHRISYILYNYESFRPEDFYIIGSNRILLNYITSVLPDLDVYGVSQMTMEQLFLRLLYEDFKPGRFEIKEMNREDANACIKGSYEWFHCLEEFCNQYERQNIKEQEVSIEKNGVVLLTKKRIDSYINESRMLSMQGKINGLNEILNAKLENELSGKSVSYTPEEKKALKKWCKFYFGRDEWRGSIYDLYDSFLASQRAKGYLVELCNQCYDVNDLAALAYLYKRIKEIDGIREATHIIIDEAQDFGMMAYGALKYCLRGCTYTIMGDVSQNIHYGYGLNDWEDLRHLILTDEYDSFSLLKKSYRNTVEISNFATEILRHGNFPIYPVEPILRHGNEVKVTPCSDQKQMDISVVKQIETWQKDGHETIAVVCHDEQEADVLRNELSKSLRVVEEDLETVVFEQGVMVLPVAYTKGLEFDAVLIYNPTNEKYPAKDEYVKLLYVAATRALHELAVFYQEDLTDLIGKPVSEEKRMQSLEHEVEPEKKIYKKQEYVITEEKKQQELDKYLQRTKKNYKEALLSKQSADTSNDSHKEAKKDSDAKVTFAKALKGKEEKDTRPKKEELIPLLQRFEQVERMNGSLHEFNEVPDTTVLVPKGHSRIDTSIRMGRKTKDCVDLISSYGFLRITPVSDSIIRVQFKKGQLGDFDKGYWDGKVMDAPAWTAKQTPKDFELLTKKLIVRVEKKTGVVSFFDRSTRLLLQEAEKTPRQIELNTDKNQTWNFMNWAKSEKLWAKGILPTDLERVSGKARYISFGRKKLRMPLMISEKGYGLGIAAEGAVIYCGIPMYGQYIYTEGMEQIDYYFIYGETTEGILKEYHRLRE